MKLFNKKEKAIEVDRDQYAVILAQTLVMCTQDFPALCERIKFQRYNIVYHYIYIMYHLYLSNILLKSKYDASSIDLITTKTIEELVDSTELTDQQKEVLLDALKEVYSSVSEIDVDLRNKNDLLKLVNDFKNYLGIGADAISQFHIMTSFSSFLIYHTEDILNNKIKIKGLN